MDWTIIISTILGCSTIMGFILYRKESKRLKKAEVEKAETEVDTVKFAQYKERIDHLHEVAKINNVTITDQSRTISMLNRALDDKTLRIRELTDKFEDSEHTVNRVNLQLDESKERIIELTNLLAKAELDKERYRNWHCRKSDCGDRLPPNPTLKGKKWNGDSTEEEPEQPTISKAVNQCV